QGPIKRMGGWRRDEYLLQKEKVIPSQTGPNPRGFGDEMLSGLGRVPPLQVERRSAEMPGLRTEVQLDLGVGFGPIADCCQASAGGFVRAGGAVLPAAVHQPGQRGGAGAVLSPDAGLLRSGRAAARTVRWANRM